MATAIALISFVVLHWAQMLVSVIGLLSALIAVFLWVPGNEPEATLQKIVDFLGKFSRKP